MLNFLIFLLISGSVQDVSVTVYNDNLALVKEKRTFDLKRGIQHLFVKDIAQLIDPTSISIDLDGVEVLEQNYRYDLVAPTKLLDKYLDNQIELVLKDGSVLRGKLLSYKEDVLTIRTREGVELVNRELVTRTSLPGLPEGLLTKPTLVWLVDSRNEGKKTGQLSYLTEGFWWHAEYVGIYNEPKMDFMGWVTVKNSSGKSYKNAKLKLVAGKVHRVTPKQPFRAEAITVKKAGFEEREFFEYHIYDLKRRTDILNNEEKQIVFVEPRTIQTTKKYVYEGGTEVKVKLEFKNEAKNNLGIPLPAGKVRIYKMDKDGALEFAGEDAIPHTPKDEIVRLYLGNAFDIKGEYKVAEARRITESTREEVREITLRNHKDESVTVTVVQRLYGDWEIINSNYDYKKINAYTIEFYPEVKANGEVKIRYTVRFYR